MLMCEVVSVKVYMNDLNTLHVQFYQLTLAQ